MSLQDDQRLINLESWAELKGLMEGTQPPPECIGVTGFPGAGKSELIIEACTGKLLSGHKPITGYVVPVPANADSGEIARQLVLYLCGAILGTPAAARLRGVPGTLPRKAGLISSVVAIVAGSVLLVLSAEGIRSNVQVDLGSVFVLAGVVGLFSWLVIQMWGPVGWVTLRRVARDSGEVNGVPYSRELCKSAAELADRLENDRWFETTVTSGWTGALTTSAGLAVGTSGSVSKKVLPTPLSALRESYVQLIAKVVAKTNLVIGIDGLDKYSPGADIDRILFELRDFLDLKELPSRQEKPPEQQERPSEQPPKQQEIPRRYYYLIALAEKDQAPHSFGQRVIGEVVRCEPLTFERVKGYIEKQPTDFPKFFADLCYAASGGLPREVETTTNFVADKLKAKTVRGLSSICRTIVEAELQTLSAELLLAARGQPSWKHQERLSDWAKHLRSDILKADDMLKADTLIADDILKVAKDIYAAAIDGRNVTSDDNPSLRLVTDRAATLSYFSSTLIEFFTNNRDPQDFKAAQPSKPKEKRPEEKSLSRLAEARRFIELATCGPAWTYISDFRDGWSMAALQTIGGSATALGPPHQDLAQPSSAPSHTTS
jgi:hypothetical protein